MQLTREPDTSPLSLLLQAIDNNDFHSAAMLLYHGNILVNVILNQNDPTDSLLVRALRNGCYRIAILLIQRGAHAGVILFNSQQFINDAIFLAMAARINNVAVTHPEDAKAAPEVLVELLKQTNPLCNIHFICLDGRSPLSVALSYCREPSTYHIGREILFAFYASGRTNSSALKNSVDHTFLNLLFDPENYTYSEVNGESWLVMIEDGMKLIRLPQMTNNPQENYNKLLTALMYNSKRHDWNSPTCVYFRLAIKKINKDFNIFSTSEDAAKQLTDIEIKSGTYWGDDLSDDSDEEDNNLFKSNRDDYFSEVSNLQKTGNFWQKTKRSTPQDRGLQAKLSELVTSIKNQKISQLTTIDAKIDEIDDTITKDAFERAKYPLQISPAQEAARIEINAIISTANANNKGQFSQTEVQRISHLCQENNLYIALHRGLNYMPIRWNAPSRRYHYKMNEVGSPQNSEMSLKALDFNFYRQLNQTTDYIKNPAIQMRVQINSQSIKEFLINLRNHSYVIGHTDDGKKTHYLFNNILEQLQHSYSNGILEFLQKFAEFRKKYPNFWGNLPNDHNFFVSAGSSPFHCLKYGYGIKEYYQEVARPRYRKDGKLEYCHLGKLYVMLYRFDELLFSAQPNNVVQLDKTGRVRLLRDIGPEKEIAFLGVADNVIFQLGARLPSFNRPWLPIDEVKYGLSKNAYEDFQYLILNLPLGSSSREKVIELLLTWLSAYHEVVINHYLSTKVGQKGILLFWGEDGLLTNDPSQILLPKGDKHRSRRIEVHTQRSIRELSAQNLTTNISIPRRNFNGFIIISEELVRNTVAATPADHVITKIKKKGKSYANVNSNEVLASNTKIWTSLTPTKPQFFTPQQQGGFQGELSRKALSTSARFQRNPETQLSETSTRKKLDFVSAFKEEDQMLALAKQLSLIDYNAANVNERNLYGLTPYDIPFVEGDCLFVGFSAHSNNKSPQYYRDLLAQSVEDSPLYQQLILRTINNHTNRNDNILTISTDVGTREQAYATIAEYLALIRQQGVWGRDIELIILSDILQRPVLVLTAKNMNDLVIELAHYRNRPPIYLNAINNNHFQPLTKPAEVDANVILTEIRAKAMPMNIHNTL